MELFLLWFICLHNLRENGITIHSSDSEVVTAACKFFDAYAETLVKSSL